MRILRKIFLITISFFLIPSLLFAEGLDDQMANALRDNGKLNVVIASAVVILAGIVFFLIYLERKIARLEKNSKSKP